MLEKTDLSLKLDKATYKDQMPELADHLLALQRACWVAGLPVLIVFEGWDASGKGTTIQKLASSLDPRGFKLHPIRAPRSHERRRPWMWRFWQKVPPRGEWAIFDRSWYGRVLVERVEGVVPEKEWRQAFRDITEFERTLTDEGYLLFKFFLHISKTEQKQRFDRLARKPKTAWQVTAEDWEHHQHYQDWFVAYEEAFERTDTEWAPWTIIEATDRRYTRFKVFQTLVNTLEQQLGPRIVEEEPSTIDQQEPRGSDGSEKQDLPPFQSSPAGTKLPKQTTANQDLHPAATVPYAPSSSEGAEET